MRIFAPRASPAPRAHPAAPAPLPALDIRLPQRTPAPSATGPAHAAASSSPASPYDFSRVPARSLQRSAAGPASHAPPIVHDVLQSPGRPLDAETRAFFEPRFGSDFGAVRVHTGAKAAESARAVRALAYTVGQNMVVGEGQFSPGTAAGRRLLAHELAHTVQQGAASTVAAATSTVGPRGGAHEREAERAAADVGRGTSIPRISRNAGRVVARAPAPMRTGTHEDRREMVDLAARFLASMADFVETRRQMAAVALATTQGSAAAPRAFHERLNQEMLGNYLRKAISVFEAQRSDNPYINFPAESPEQTRLGEAYARVMEQLGLAIEEARANAANLAPTVEATENTAYARNHLRWMEANPAMPLSAGIRTTFTQTEVDVSTRRHQRTTTELGNLTANLHRYDLAGDGADRLRIALLNATYRLQRDAATGEVNARPDAALQTTIQPVLDQLRAIRWAIDSAVDRLRRAEARTRAFATDPAANATIGDALQAHFSTRDPGYATLLADRFARMQRELRGQGALTVHARDPRDPGCGAGSIGGGFSLTVAHADANRFHFCTSVTMGDQEIVGTVVHETVHAVVPSLGATAPVATSRDTPGDRAYAYERIYSRLSTEEALDNAESYSFYIDTILGIAVTRDAAPRDTVSGCTDADAVHNALARATYRIRLAAMWAEQNSAAPTPQFVINIVQQGGFPGADAARAAQVVMHLRNLAGRLDRPLSVSCRPATDAEARAGALAYGRSTRVTASGVAGTSRSYPPGALRICPAWFQAGTAVQEDSITSILVPHYRSSVPTGDVAGLVSLLRHIQEQAQPSPSGRTLAQHQAADRPPPPPPPPPPRRGPNP